jgi:hypothetical protein
MERGRDSIQSERALEFTVVMLMAGPPVPAINIFGRGKRARRMPRVRTPTTVIPAKRSASREPVVHVLMWRMMFC